MKHPVAILAIGVAALLGASSAAPGITRGTLAEAHAMLQKATSHYKEVGRDGALADFTAGKAPFKDRDLFVFCVAADHKLAASGGFPAYVGTSADAFVDAKGNALGKALWDAAGKDVDGSIEYPMLNPETRKTELKTSFYAKVAEDLLCGVGAYSVP